MTCAGDEQVDKMMTSGYGRWCLLSACLALHDEDLSIWKRLTVPYQLARCSEQSNWNYSMIICLLAPHGLLLLVEEILHQLICSLSHHLQGFTHLRWLFGIASINSSSTWATWGTSGKTHPQFLLGARHVLLRAIRFSHRFTIRLASHQQRGYLTAWFCVELQKCPKFQESLQNISNKTNQNPHDVLRWLAFLPVNGWRVLPNCHYIFIVQR